LIDSAADEREKNNNQRKEKKKQQEHWGNEMRTEMPGCSPHWFFHRSPFNP
jgi:hypothetical protein